MIVVYKDYEHPRLGKDKSQCLFTDFIRSYLTNKEDRHIEEKQEALTALVANLLASMMKKNLLTYAELKEFLPNAPEIVEINEDWK